jgi:PAS domain S-box-containing protein
VTPVHHSVPTVGAEFVLRVGGEAVPMDVLPVVDGYSVHRPVREPDGAIVDFVLVTCDRRGRWFPPAGRVPGETMASTLPVDIRDRVIATCARVLSTGRPELLELVDTTGEQPSQIEAIAMRAGHLLALVHRDVTARLVTERQLHRSVEEYSSLAHSLPDQIMRFDRELVLRFVNRAAMAAIGHDGLVGRSAASLFGGYHLGWFVERLERVRRTLEPDSFDLEYRGRPYHARLVPELDDDGRLRSILTVSRDVTEERRLEDERRQHLGELARQASLLEHASEAINVCDLEGRVTYWNRGAEELYGWTAAEAIGRDIRELVGEIDGDVESSKAALLAHNGEWRGRLPQTRRDGTPIVVDLFLSLVDDGGPDTGHTLGIAADVTDRVVLEERLRQAERIDAIGRLAGGIAHDFNNLLTVMVGAAELLESRLAHDPGSQALAGSVLRAAHRGADLTSRLLSFGRRQTLRPQLTDPAAVVAEVVDLVRRTIEVTTEIAVDVPSTAWPISIDVGLFEMALVNLCLNARDAMSPGGRLTLTCRNVDEALALPGSLVHLPAGEFVAVEVRDTGSGMTDDVRALAFDPFFTTKAIGQGSGLGLSMVHGFVHQSGGHVTIESVPGAGTTVSLYLPRLLEDAGNQPARIDAASPGAVPSGSWVVLVVEDDPDVRALVAQLVDQLGHVALQACDAAAALAVVESGTRVDLVMSDVVMPGSIDGLGLVEILRERRPGLAVLLTSGFTGGDELGPSVGSVPFLAKPYTRHELASAIMRAVGAAHA